MWKSDARGFLLIESIFLLTVIAVSALLVVISLKTYQKSISLTHNDDTEIIKEIYYE